MQNIHVDPAGFACSITPSENQMVIRINMPTITMQARSYGHCETEACALGICVCLDSLTVDVVTDISITGMYLEFTVTEDSIRDGTPIPMVFEPGVLSYQVASNNSDRGCIAGFFSDVLGVLAEIFTFGAFDPGRRPSRRSSRRTCSPSWTPSTATP